MNQIGLLVIESFDQGMMMIDISIIDISIINISIIDGWPIWAFLVGHFGQADNHAVFQHFCRRKR